MKKRAKRQFSSEGKISQQKRHNHVRIHYHPSKSKLSTPGIFIGGSLRLKKIS